MHYQIDLILKPIQKDPIHIGILQSNLYGKKNPHKEVKTSLSGFFYEINDV